MRTPDGIKYADTRIKRLPVYKEARRIAMNGEKRYLVFKGGRGSGKSWEMANIFIDKCLRDPHRRVLACRKVKKDTKASVLKQATDVIKHLGIGHKVRINEHEGFIRFDNGAEFLTAGLDDPNKVKSYSGITDAWFEEAFDTNYKDFETIDLGIRGEHAEDATFGLTFNPLNWRNWINDRFFINEDPDAYTLTTTYRDNPMRGESYERILQKIKDPNSRRVLLDGDWGNDVKGLIYPAWHEPEEGDPFGWLHASMPEGGQHAFGLDFGFNNPMALVELRLVDRSALYCKERLYRTGMTTGDLIAWMNANEIPKNALIVADSAEPDRIEEIYRAGFRGIVAANKGPGSVNAGISVVQGLQLYITEGSHEIETELTFYKWAVDKNEVPLDKPITELDHAMDAIRYGAVHLMTQKVFTGEWGQAQL